jgi:aminopeptidase N
MEAIGEDEFLSILSEYCKTYAFKIATTEDFLEILKSKSSVDVEGIVEKYIRQ